MSAHDDSCHALLNITRALGITTNLDNLLQMIVDYSMELLHAERASIFLYDKNHHELYSRIAEGTGELRFPADKGLAGATAMSLQIINVPDAYADSRFNREVDKKTGYRTRNILSSPLVDFNGALVGVLQILNKKTGAFDSQDEDLAAAFSAQAGVALQRAHLIEEFLLKQKMEHALKVAGEIQQNLFPKSAPHLDGFDIAVWNRPCDEIGGDFCDFIPLDDKRLMLILGDVTGHGVGPALISMGTRAMLRAMFHVNDDLQSVLIHAHKLLKDDLPGNRFVTTFLGMLNRDSGQLQYFSAGQGPLLWYHADTGKTDALRANSIPMGIMEDVLDPTLQSLQLQKDDIFALLTDGFFEWAKSDGTMFGSDRVAQVLLQNGRLPASEILEAIRKTLSEFADTPQADDLTAILFKRA